MNNMQLWKHTENSALLVLKVGDYEKGTNVTVITWINMKARLADEAVAQIASMQQDYVSASYLY